MAIAVDQKSSVMRNTTPKIAIAISYLIGMPEILSDV
jgi:hypothetical protein